jgi:hypothetical protein
MTDKPIIFSAPMVRALQDGRKTQTRRVLKPPPDTTSDPSGQGKWGSVNRYGYWRPVAEIFPVQSDDRLWVKEAVAWVSGWGWRYRADNDDLSEKREQGEVGRWRSPIHMPRWASRITLTVTDVRVQRLSEISLGDCYAEGCTVGQTEANSGALSVGWTGPWHEYRSLWNSLHGPDAWDANPWVYALTFTVQLGNIDAMKGGAE